MLILLYFIASEFVDFSPTKLWEIFYQSFDISWMMGVRVSKSLIYMSAETVN